MQKHFNIIRGTGGFLHSFWVWSHCQVPLSSFKGVHQLPLVLGWLPFHVASLQLLRANLPQTQELTAPAVSTTLVAEFPFLLIGCRSTPPPDHLPSAARSPAWLSGLPCGCAWLDVQCVNLWDESSANLAALLTYRQGPTLSTLAPGVSHAGLECTDCLHKCLCACI
jgi:hypothetical protein